jgi:hypothetical protein
MKQFIEAGIGAKRIQLYNVAGVQSKSVLPVSLIQEGNALVAVSQTRIHVGCSVPRVCWQFAKDLPCPGHIARLLASVPKARK